MLFALCALVMTSCDKKSEGQSRVTYYPSITLNGDTYLIWEKGAAKVLRIVGLSQFWSRDLSLLASNILYIVILMVLMSILPRVFAKTKQEKKEDI